MGFRGFGSAATDEQVWTVWQENDLDAASQLGFVDAMVKGLSYGLVQPNGTGQVPTVTIEDALDCITETDPRNRRLRRAGLKRWVDDDGYLTVVLYLPDAVYKYRTKAAWSTDMARLWGTLPPGALTPEANGVDVWSASGMAPYQPEGDDEWPLPNPMGVVPLVPLPNRPRLREEGQSEIKPVRSNQDAINKYRADALITSEFAAYPQRYLLNYEPERDPDTGRAIEPFRAAIDRLWTVPPPDPDIEGAPEPKIGSLPSADLRPYAEQIALEVGHMAAISRLPYHYLLSTPQSVPPSGESLKASEAGLEHKTARGKLFMGEGLEELMRVALLAQDTTAPRTGETVWTDSETRNEAVRTDAIVKLHAEGIIDDELAWEMAGLSPEQVRAMKERIAAAEAAEEKEAMDAAAAEAAALRAAGPPEAPNGAAGPALPVPAPTGPRMGTNAVV
jgi:hypothetical protein